MNKSKICNFVNKATSNHRSGNVERLLSKALFQQAGNSLGYAIGRQECDLKKDIRRITERLLSTQSAPDLGVIIGAPGYLNQFKVVGES